MAPLRPFFSYFGSKWRLAKLYPEPKHDTIIEPFAGSACYSLHYHDRNIRLYDKDPVIVGVWKYLIGASERDVLSLPQLRQGESLDEFNLSQEAKWLLGFWIGRTTSSPRRTVTKAGASDGKGYSYLNALPKRVASQLQYIRHWRIGEGSYDSVPNVAATWFIDPPYQLAGKQYVYGSKQIDYNDVALFCKSRQGQLIACENAGADWLPFKELSRLQGMTSNGAVRYSVESVYLQDTGGADHASG